MASSEHTRGSVAERAAVGRQAGEERITIRIAAGDALEGARFLLYELHNLTQKRAIVLLVPMMNAMASI